MSKVKLPGDSKEKSRLLTAEKLTEILKDKMTLEEYISLSSYPNQEAIGRALTFAVGGQRELTASIKNTEIKELKQLNGKLRVELAESKPKSKTEELKKRVDQALCDFAWNYKTATIYKPHLRNQERENKRDLAVTQVLKACKAMGMEFVNKKAPIPDNEVWHKDARLYEAFCAGINIVVQNGWNKTEEMEFEA